jgi:ABC-type amino acid transport system permease subunit
MFGELLAPQYLHWLFDGFVLTLILSLLTCLVATGLGFLLCLATDLTLAPLVMARTGISGAVS